MENKQNTAVGYLRVSGRAQLGGDGFERQKDTIRQYAAAHDLRILEWFEERAVSGTKREGERPAFKEMLGSLMANSCRLIVVESLDRLARRYRIQEELILYLASKKISLIAANTGEDVTAAIQEDAMRRALVQMQGVFAEFERSMLIAKLRKARERKRRETGKCEGRPVYGTLPGETEVLAKIRRLNRKPRGGRRPSFQRIADALNAEGVPTRYSRKPWDRGTIRAIVRRQGWPRDRQDMDDGDRIGQKAQPARLRRSVSTSFPQHTQPGVAFRANSSRRGGGETRSIKSLASSGFSECRVRGASNQERME